MIKGYKNDAGQLLSDFLTLARENSNLSVRDLGELIGEPHQFVVKVENLQRGLGISEFFYYCQGLNIDPIEGIKLLEKDLKKSRP